MAGGRTGRNRPLRGRRVHVQPPSRSSRSGASREWRGNHAVEHRIRLVVNPINGMRHIDENVAMYEHLNFPEGRVQQVLDECRSVLDGSDYLFATELLQHLDYVGKVFTDRKLRISYPRRCLIFEFR